MSLKKRNSNLITKSVKELEVIKQETNSLIDYVSVLLNPKYKKEDGTILLSEEEQKEMLKVFEQIKYINS